MIPLKKSVWAQSGKDERLIIESGSRPVQMKNSDATGLPLLSFNNFGADIIHFAPGNGVGLHVHEGDHILFVLKGKGRLTYDTEVHELFAGLCYLIPGSVAHAIDAVDELILIAVGNSHQALESFERMTPVI